MYSICSEIVVWFLCKICYYEQEILKKIMKNEAEYKTNERIASPSYGNSTILKNLVNI